MDEMQNPEVAALQQLCDKEGGFRVVANAIGHNDQSIYQILTFVKLPSGRPKGIGPALRKKLSARYPGWNASAAIADDPLGSMPDRLKATLMTIAAILQTIPEDQWGNAVVDIATMLRKDQRYR